MHKYSIEIPNNKLTAYRIVTAIVLFINAAIFIAFPFDDTNWKHALTISGGVISLLGMADLFQKRKKKKIAPLVFFTSAAMWLLLGKYWVAICMLIFAIMSLNTLKDLVILFSDEGITYPSFPQKIYSWNEVSQVILKDDILTIDLKNNQLLQFTLMPEALEGIDVREFNGAMGEWMNVP